ncbi:MAG: hypothetical protein GXN92_00675 [Candidatus Micrarchaeota archaeon]|nr:hypothetical protein [Candidatus Micrarchaeota archaeon]
MRFGTAGIRGRYWELTPKEAYEIALKIGSQMGKKIALAMDGRNNSQALKDSIRSALLYLGKEVYDIGLAPTPTLQLYITQQGMDGGFMVTASHNPPEWNGIKVIDHRGVVLPKERANPMLEHTPSEFRPHNVFHSLDYTHRHAFHLLEHLGMELDKSLAVDYGNGVGVKVFSHVLPHIAQDYLEINDRIDGNFPGRNSEPVPANLTKLQSLLNHYDIGIAFDGDADRAVLMTKKHFIDGDLSLALAASLLDSPKVVMTVATSKVVEDIVGKENVIYTKVGVPYIAEAVLEHNATLGGEESGGLIYPKVNVGKDGLATALLLLKLTKGDLDSYVERLPRYVRIKEKIAVPGDKKHEIVERLKQTLPQHFSGDVITLDGIRINMKDSWFIIRPSGTEDYIRIFVEARTKEKAQQLMEELKELVF